MEELYLVYINVLNRDWEGNNVYEFIFSNITEAEKLEGTDWDVYPASNSPTPPSKEYIKKVGELKTGIELSTAQQSGTFSMYDAVDGVISLGWEKADQYDEYPEKRMVFMYGDDIEKVEYTLYAKDLVLNYIVGDEH